MNDLYRSKIKKIDTEFSILSISVTDRCNLSCHHCYNNSRPNNPPPKLSWHELRDLVDKYLDATIHCKASDICITGGEPLLRVGVFDFLEYIFSHPKWKKNSILSLQTNGTLIGEKLAEDLANTHIRTWISLDGPTREIHDRLRGCGSFKKVIKGIKNMGKFNAWFGCAFFPTPFNLLFIKETYDLVHELGCKKFAILDILKIGRILENKTVFGLDIIDLYKALNNFYKKYPYLYSEIPSLLSKDLETIKNDEPIACGVIKNFTLHIFSDGYAVPCYALDRKNWGLGNVIDENFDIIETFYTEPFQCIRKYVNTTLNSRCAKCEVFGLCGGGCPAENILYHSDYLMDENICENYQIPRIKYLLEILKSNPNYNNIFQIKKGNESMPKRKCASCGKEKDVYRGKICTNDHFLCQSCARTRTTCPLDGKPLK